jgi:hypothetical protein
MSTATGADHDDTFSDQNKLNFAAATFLAACPKEDVVSILSPFFARQPR